MARLHKKYPLEECIVVILVSLFCLVTSLPIKEDLTQNCWYDGKYHSPGIEIVSMFDQETKCKWIKLCRHDGEIVYKEGLNCLITEQPVTKTILPVMRDVTARKEFLRKSTVSLNKKPVGDSGTTVTPVKGI